MTTSEELRAQAVSGSLLYRAADEIEALQKQVSIKRCEHCGSHLLWQEHTPCPRCGAPQCCQQCCKIATLEQGSDQLRAAVAALQNENATLRNKVAFQAAELNVLECDLKRLSSAINAVML